MDKETRFAFIMYMSKHIYFQSSTTPVISHLCVQVTFSHGEAKLPIILCNHTFDLHVLGSFPLFV